MKSEPTYQRFYEITVTNPSGKIIDTRVEYSGYATSEEMMMLRREYPDDCKIEAEFKEIELI